jgi:hypothetical protein
MSEPHPLLIAAVGAVIEITERVNAGEIARFDRCGHVGDFLFELVKRTAMMAYRCQSVREVLEVGVVLSRVYLALDFGE